jgi:ribonuclease-3
MTTHTPLSKADLFSIKNIDQISLMIENDHDMHVFQRAFTHTSASDPGCGDYESLEFLGDSVLQHIITVWLTDRFPDYGPGELTIIRTRLVSGKMLSKLAEETGLTRHIRFDQQKCAGKKTEFRLAEDVFESFLGALYTTNGLLKTKQWVLSLYNSIDLTIIISENRNFKSYLNQLCHSLKLDTPMYISMRMDTGEYRSKCKVRGVFDHGEAIDASKKAAEQKAARELYYMLGGGPPTFLA